ncbi:MAG: hypothetical protein KDD53_06735, partial [Bdellovibrionales bacterium]|nr:hypothetical protein [Bdellovibrionales bacterium]
MANSNVKLRAPRQFTSPRVRVPGSKSFTNRALISAACGTGKATLRGYSKSDDTEVLISALEVLGVGFEEQATELSVTGSAGKFSPYIGDINVGAAGTSMRFLTALCSFVEGCAVVLKGSERMHERPIDDLVEPLRFLGADIEYLGTRGCPPILIRGVGTTSSCLVEVKG